MLLASGKSQEVAKQRLNMGIYGGESHGVFEEDKFILQFLHQYLAALRCRVVSYISQASVPLSVKEGDMGWF